MAVFIGAVRTPKKKRNYLSNVIIYDNGGKTFDRYTIFTPDGSVYGMSESGGGFNQYLGDDTEVEKGSHLGKRLKSVPKSIEKAVMQRMNDSYAKGGMTEHGLRIKDTILGDYANDTIIVRNSMGDMERVNLNEGKRFGNGGGVEEVKYEVVNRNDKHYGKVGVSLHGWNLDERGRYYCTLQFPNGSVSTYGEGEVRPYQHKGMRFSEGGGVDLFSMSKTIIDRGQISEIVIAENVSVDEFNKLFSDKGYRKVNDNSLVGFYFAKPNGDTIQLIPSFHKKGEIIKYSKGGGVSDRMTDEEIKQYEKGRYIHFNPMNSRWEVWNNGELKEFWNQEQAEKFAGFEFDDDKDSRYSRKKYESLFGYGKGGGVYNRSWHFDHDRHNKSENYEIPMNRRKKAHGGTIEERMRMRRGM